MKTEDIDKRIGMPDVDKEWARFEQEVIGKEAKAGKNLWLWGLSIAASIPPRARYSAHFCALSSGGSWFR